jgi:hypothetical protein
MKWPKNIRMRMYCYSLEKYIYFYLLNRNRLFPFHGRFSELKTIFKNKENYFDGILLDAGTR